VNIRHRHIQDQLDTYLALKVINLWYAQNAMPGKRWRVAAQGFDRTMSTVEVEVFLAGIAVGRTPLALRVSR
jgi:hypothetical protein